MQGVRCIDIDLPTQLGCDRHTSARTCQGAAPPGERRDLTCISTPYTCTSAQYPNCIDAYREHPEQLVFLARHRWQILHVPPLSKSCLADGCNCSTEAYCGSRAPIQIPLATCRQLADVLACVRMLLQASLPDPGGAAGVPIAHLFETGFPVAMRTLANRPRSRRPPGTTWSVSSSASSEARC